MPILYVNFDESYDCLKKEPYSMFTKKFNAIKENINEKEFEIRLGDGKNNGNFANGFYTDGFYCNNLSLNFKFANTDSKNGKSNAYFTRMTYSYEYDNKDELEYHLKKIQAFKLRVPYIYIPYASYFDFNFQMDENKFKWNFDVLVSSIDDIPQTCYSMINTIIALFAFDEWHFQGS